MKCFSMILAPRTVATIGAVEPIVWSDKPGITLYFSDKSLIINKLASSIGAG